VASQAVGIKELADAIASYEDYLQKKNLVMNKSVENWRQRLVEMLRDTMLEKARKHIADGGLSRYAAEVAEHRRDPYTLVEEIAANVGKS
jgi:putative protein kinase ArgK-like GTPase of G3E family